MKLFLLKVTTPTEVWYGNHQATISKEYNDRVAFPEDKKEALSSEATIKFCVVATDCADIKVEILDVDSTEYCIPYERIKGRVLGYITKEQSLHFYGHAKRELESDLITARNNLHEAEREVNDCEDHVIGYENELEELNKKIKEDQS